MTLLTTTPVTLAEAVKLCLEDRERRCMEASDKTLSAINEFQIIRRIDRDTLTAMDGCEVFLTDDILGITKFNVYQTEGIEG